MHDLFYKFYNAIEDPKGKGLLVPDFINKPLLKDDICDIDCDWGPEYYITHFPFLDRTMNDKYPFQ